MPTKRSSVRNLFGEADGGDLELYGRPVNCGIAGNGQYKGKAVTLWATGRVANCSHPSIQAYLSRRLRQRVCFWLTQPGTWSIPPNASQGLLEINGLRFALQLGALYPSSEDIGIQRRLANLGFYRGQLDGKIGPQTRAAISDFQARTGLNVSGEPRSRLILYETRLLLHAEAAVMISYEPPTATSHPRGPCGYS